MQSSMLPIMVFLMVVCGLVLRKLKPEERLQLVRTVVQHARQFATIAIKVIRETPAGCDEFSCGAWPLNS